MKIKLLQLLNVFLLMLLFSCSGGEMTENKVQYNSLEEVPDVKWLELSKQNIYFAHQSVGFNILDGIKDLMKENKKINLTFVEDSGTANFKPHIFFHSEVGENRNPKSKVDNFVSNLDSGFGKKMNIAALKFCYVDFSYNSDPKKIFEDYKHNIDLIKQKNPKLKFIHFTAPLTVRKTGLKLWIKRKLGKTDNSDKRNVVRNEYNKLILAEYSGKESIVDIAKIESTYQDGTRAAFKNKGVGYYSMVPEYSSDGGHLNESGRKKVAQEFLLQLINLSD